MPDSTHICAWLATAPAPIAGRRIGGIMAHLHPGDKAQHDEIRAAIREVPSPISTSPEHIGKVADLQRRLAAAAVDLLRVREELPEGFGVPKAFKVYDLKTDPELQEGRRMRLSELVLMLMEGDAPNSDGYFIEVWAGTKHDMPAGHGGAA